ncbi:MULTISPECIES: dihydrofolate reductase family protein [unclassified Microbacterium]|uniref:dihydrofolate reductase family protein n=1 Tax=unclassified Microbacterium TaxID=2609290 RepID=UPI0008F553FB|nr:MULTISPECIES: dihydrofolate reductase family protein [unclassified Microbacterium]OIJ33467.1 deaminase [Microbacterium sp. LCT-H2]
MATHYFTASSLDGFIATAEHSLDWLLSQDIDMEGPMAYPAFEKSIGALVMGASTFEWVMRHEEGRWTYTQPTWVLSHRDLTVPEGADVRVTSADIRDVHAAMLDAAGGKDLWVVGGGDLAGQFADAGLLDEVWVQYAPVTLGSGAPLLPRRLDLELIEVARNRSFLCGRYRVAGAAAGPSAP